MARTRGGSARLEKCADQWSRSGGGALSKAYLGGTTMNTKALALALMIAAAAGAAEARGCLKGAVIGGVAGHIAHHHALTGAVIGCVVSHHMAHEHDRRLALQAHQRR
jgi:hypothetical protein